MISHRPRVRTGPRRVINLISALFVAALLSAPMAHASASADLASSIVSPSTTSVGSYLYYTITGKNNGPDAASNVVISDHTPWYPWAAHPTTFYCVGGGTAWCGPVAAGMTCTHPPVGSPGTVSCATGSLALGTSMTITVVVHVGFFMDNQLVSDSATTTSTTFDSNTANNTASVYARVT
jgi:Domain of unknown function DUF11